MTAFTVRPLIHRDIEDVLAIQALSPEISRWTLWDYDRVAHGDMSGWVAETEAGELAGFLVARRIASDLEILNFAVRPAARRQGVGRVLLEAVMQWAKTFGAQQAFLEVRASNLAALQFYERHNFHVTGRRPRYYTEPVEDGLVLNASIS